MITIPRHPKFLEWSEQSYSDTTFPCVICGKPIKNDKVRYRVCVDNGGEKLLTPQEAKEHPERVEQLGMWPIGSGCSKDHPELKEYLVVEGEQ